MDIPSQTYPTTLPSQLVVDKSESNIYFPEHGGNRISKIDTKSGIMTEYDIPTGPLSTALFIAVSEDGKKVWFTEWASNKIAYLDTTIPVPFRMQVIEKDLGTTPIILKVNEPKTFKVIITNADKKNNYYFLADIFPPFFLPPPSLLVLLLPSLTKLNCQLLE